MASNEIKIVGGQPDGRLLRELRGVFDESQSALLCVAFINRRGVALLENEISRIGRNGRVLLTTVFGETTKPALAVLKKAGVEVKILNLSQGTYHPKVYVSEASGLVSAAVGSANLTSGLIKNIEVMTVLKGQRDWQPIREVRELAEDLWNHRSAASFDEILMWRQRMRLFPTICFIKSKKAFPADKKFSRLPKDCRIKSSIFPRLACWWKLIAL